MVEYFIAGAVCGAMAVAWPRLCRVFGRPDEIVPLKMVGRMVIIPPQGGSGTAPAQSKRPVSSVRLPSPKQFPPLEPPPLWNR